MSAASTLPSPAATHATCAWCRRDFGSIVELIDHAAEHDAVLAALNQASGWSRFAAE